MNALFISVKTWPVSSALSASTILAVTLPPRLSGLGAAVASVNFLVWKTLRDHYVTFFYCQFDVIALYVTSQSIGYDTIACPVCPRITKRTFLKQVFRHCYIFNQKPMGCEESIQNQECNKIHPEVEVSSLSC